MPRFSPVDHIETAGQGTLWNAHDAETGEYVVVKYLHKSGNLKTDQIAAQRFEREVRKQSKLTSPHIMPILAHNFTEDPPWYAMPRADLTLADRLRTTLPLSIPELSNLMTAVFDGIGTAHSAGVIHRDLKPANILRLTEADVARWVVADFGLCRDVHSDNRILTRSSTTVGSIQYMAPEQFVDAHRVAFTADVYAIGCTIYHCLVGVGPGYRQLDYDRVPAPFREVVARATALERADRYPNVRSFRLDFERAVGLQEVAGETSSRHREVFDGADISWIEHWAASSGDVHSLPVDRFTKLVKYLLQRLGYQIADDTDCEKIGIDFIVSDPAHGTMPVKTGRHRYLVPSAVLHQLIGAMGATGSRHALLVSTGTLSPEAQQLSAADNRIILVEGPVLHEIIQGQLRTVSAVS
jgi:serine/threonine protein kinase